jgi:hypothetical protein
VTFLSPQEGREMTMYDSFIKNIEKKSGLSISEIREKDPCELRKYFEKKFGTKTRFVSEFPFIGRGNVLRDGIIDSDQINEEIDKLLKNA